MEKIIQGVTPNKEELLKQTQGGLLLLIVLFGDDFKLNKDGRKSKNMYNPFYKDTNPGLSFYLGDNGVWRFSDFGDSKYQGDVFDFFARYFNLNVVSDFQYLLQRMWELYQSKESDLPKLPNLPKLAIKEVERVEPIGEGFTKQGLDYWIKYGVSQELLEENKVVQLTGAIIHYKDGTSETKTFGNKNLTFGYEVNQQCYKIYCPNPKKFWYVGDKPKDFVLGEIGDIVLLETPMFVCAGNKDAMVVRSLGFEAITLSSETALMPRKIMKDLYEARYKTIILYDNDDTGRNQAKILLESCYGEIADLSSIFTEKEKEEIKDVADFVKADLKNNRPRLLKFLLRFVPNIKDHISDVSFFFEKNPDLLSIAKEHCNTVFEQNEEGQGKENETILEEEVEQSNDEGDDEDEDENEDETDFDIPGLDPDLYEKLPQLLKAVVRPLSEPHEKALVLISTLCVLGNVFKVSGIYDSRRIFSNVMAFITAPASAGKGAMKFAKILGKAFEDRFKTIYDEEKEAYKIAINNGESAEKPYRKRFFLSGNSSTAALINSFYNSNGKAVILEYEADMLNNAKVNKTWGDFSVVLRNAFEHETITKFRVDDEIDIDCPRLSVAISGTKNQLFEFIPSVENGLFSRFIFYEFPLIPIFKNVFEKKEDLVGYYEELSNDLLKFYDDHDDIEFEFTSSQEKQFLKYFTKNHDQFYALLGKDSVSIVRRLGSICFRIAMVLSVSKYVYEDNVPTKIICSDDDFYMALSMSGTFIKQAENLYLTLPRTNKKYEILKTNEQKLIEELPNEFTFQRILEVGERLDIAKGTVERYLRKYVKYNLVERLKHGSYKKLA